MNDGMVNMHIDKRQFLILINSMKYLKNLEWMMKMIMVMVIY